LLNNIKIIIIIIIIIIIKYEKKCTTLPGHHGYYPESPGETSAPQDLADVEGGRE